MRFFISLAQASGKNGKGKIALFFSWFAVICSFIAAIFLTLLLQSPWPETAAKGAGLLVAAVITGVMILLSFVFWLIVLTSYFGRQHISKDGVETQASFPVAEIIQTKLWGMEIVRGVHGAWRDIAPAAFPSVPEPLAWSWIAFNHHKNPQTVSEPQEVLEAAVWHLLASGLVSMKVREEKNFLLSRLFKGAEITQIYIAPKATRYDPPEGAWERILLQKINDPELPYLPLDLFDWIVCAFGDTTSTPERTVVAVTEDEFVEKGWGLKTGGFSPRFEYAAGYVEMAQHTQRWPETRLWIESHNAQCPNLARLVRDRIEAALKDRVDAS